jgi:hypothetical protein
LEQQVHVALALLATIALTDLVITFRKILATIALTDLAIMFTTMAQRSLATKSLATRSLATRSLATTALRSLACPVTVTDGNVNVGSVAKNLPILQNQ